MNIYVRSVARLHWMSGISLYRCRVYYPEPTSVPTRPRDVVPYRKSLRAESDRLQWIHHTRL